MGLIRAGLFLASKNLVIKEAEAFKSFMETAKGTTLEDELSTAYIRFKEIFNEALESKDNHKLFEASNILKTTIKGLNMQEVDLK